LFSGGGGDPITALTADADAGPEDDDDDGTLVCRACSLWSVFVVMVDMSLLECFDGWSLWDASSFEGDFVSVVL
jgi:hypothetical protein